MTVLPNMKHVKGGQAVALRVSKFLFVFNLRQGAILIAIQHIALSACALLLLLVGIAHAQEMMGMLNADMEDNAEREGAILLETDHWDVALGPHTPTEPTNNQQKFKAAQDLAMMVVFLLYGGLVGTAIYLVFSVALFYGAAKKKKEYMMPWAFSATFLILLLAGVIVLGDNSTILTEICGGQTFYRIGGAVVLISHIYCIIAVASFVYELSTLKDSESSLKLHVDLNEKNSLIAQDKVNNLILSSKVTDANVV